MKSDHDPDRDRDPEGPAGADPRPTGRSSSSLQQNCKRPLAAIGEEVGLSASSVMERIHKLEAAGVIRGDAALLDARRLGLDVAAFIESPSVIRAPRSPSSARSSARPTCSSVTT